MSPLSTPYIFLLVRDPRDVILSAMDHIRFRGIDTWPGLSNEFTQNEWEQLSMKEKIDSILISTYDDTHFSCLNNFEAAKNLCNERRVMIIKYEDILDTPNDSYILIMRIARYFGLRITQEQAKAAFNSAYLNENSPTLNTGRAYRYLTEYPEELLLYVESIMAEYLHFFKYS